MADKLIPKLLIVTLAVVVPIFLLYSLYLEQKFYNNIFRLSSNQIYDSLIDAKPQCKKIGDCKLLPGDILIRRYITSRTWLIDKLAHPYFTHAAFYSSNNQLVEAIGTEKNSQDDIQINVFSKSDWLNFDVNDFVIIRPQNYSSKLNIIETDLRNIAEDPDYIFGLPKQGHKRATCADLIFEQLTDKNIITISNRPQIITPDYLFWLAVNNQADFEIIGYNISK